MFSANLFVGTLRIWRTPIVWWPIGLFLYVFVDGWLVSIVAQTVNVGELFSSLPNVFLQLFAGAGASADLARGAYGGFLFYFNGVFFGIGPILAALYAMFFAPGLLAGEWDRGTLDTLLSRPLTRRAYVLTRFAVFVAVTAVIAVVIFLAHVLVIGPVAGYDVPLRGVAQASAAWALIAVAFGAVAFLVASLRLATGAGTAAALALLLLMEILNVAGLTSDVAKPLAELSFFKYWKPLDMLFRETAELTAFALAAIVAIAGLVGATLVFERRDLA